MVGRRLDIGVANARDKGSEVGYDTNAPMTNIPSSGPTQMNRIRDIRQAPLLAAALFLLSAGGLADTFFWNLPEGETGAFTERANWSLERPGGAPAPRIPGGGDALSDATGYNLDLGGETREIGRWEHVTWEPRTFRISNGTLRVRDAMELHSGRLEIEKGGTLDFRPGSLFYPGKNDANPREVEVRGTLDLSNARVQVYNLDLTVRREGRFFFKPASFTIEGAQTSRIRNEGLLNLAYGLVAEGGELGGMLRIENAPDGVISVGGDISNCGHQVKMELILEGGRLVFPCPCDAGYHISSARIMDGASIDVWLCDGAAADLSSFSFGSEVRLNLSVRGMVGGSAVLSDLPSRLMAQDHLILTLAPPREGDELVIDSEKMSMGNGARLVLAGNRIRLDRLPKWFGDIALGVDSALVAPDAPMLLSGDPAVLDAVATKMEGTLPDGASLERREGALWLRVEPRVTFWHPRAAGAPAPHFEVEADRANRCFRINAVGFGDEVAEFEYEVQAFESEVLSPKSEVGSPESEVHGTEGRSPVGARVAGAHRRFRFPDFGDAGPRPFTVRATVHTREWGDFTTNLVVRPNSRPITAPFSIEDVKLGMSVDINDTRLHCEAVTNEMANLLVCGAFDTPSLDQDGFPVAVREKIARDGIAMMTIYAAGREPPVLIGKFKEQYGDRYLGNNIGEYCGYLYQTKAEALAASVPQGHDVLQAKERFVEEWMHKGAAGMLEGRPYLITTSGSPLANYEMQGGADFVCTELYAVGSANLAYATGEARGAARRWKPEYWMGWLAEEWQSLGIPYNVPQKQALLKAGFLQEWLMGTSVMVLESGPLGTRAQEYTAADPDTGVTPTEGYDGKIAAAYRKTVKDFYDFLRANPRASGSPETKIAFALGNGDSFVGMSVDWFAVWGLHEKAETNALYRYGPPEDTWLRVQDTFFPRGPEALAPYPNAWLAGSPFGQIDVVGVDEDSLPSDLTRYALVAFAGWNTMTPPACTVLERYVEAGGTLVMCVPHLSTRADREYRDYGAGDLLVAPGGIRVTGGPVETSRGIWLAQLFLPPGADVLESIDGLPFLVRVPAGQGSVYLCATWDYPGRVGALADAYDSLLRRLAAAVPQRVRIAPADGRDDTAYISFAAYGDRAYVLNLDTLKPRTVRLLVEGREPQEVALEPLELRTTYWQ